MAFQKYFLITLLWNTSDNIPNVHNSVVNHSSWCQTMTQSYIISHENYGVELPIKVLIPGKWCQLHK